SRRTAGPHRPRRPEAQGHQRLPGRPPRPRGRGPAAAPDDRGRQLQRGLPRRGARPRRPPAGRRERGWTVAMTTLLHERELIGSGGGDGRQFGSAASFERVAATAAHFGRSADRRLRQRLAGFYIAGRLAELNSARAAARARAGQPPGPEMAGAKLALAAHLNDAAALLGEILGPHLAADSGRWGGYGWLEFVLGTPGIRIAGGTDEVLRNVIAERVLGLPR